MNVERYPLEPGPWPHRLALAAALAAVPLVLFGGSVTTIGAGMAVDGWLVAEGHFLLFFPVEEWFRDTATFVEHTHRLFGVLVGIFVLAAVVASFLRERAAARALSLASLIAVCGQGALGGLRVLEDDSQLAFLHGALAQAVFALLCAHALFLSPAWRRTPVRATAAHPSVHRLAAVAGIAVYLQVVLGAWLRHASRPSPEANAELLLLAHAVGAVLAAGVLIALARSARRTFPAQARRLVLLLAVQLFLGVLSWIAARPESIGPLEWGVTIAHVLCGGLLLAQTVALWMWASRQAAPVPVCEIVPLREAL